MMRRASAMGIDVVLHDVVYRSYAQEPFAATAGGQLQAPPSSGGQTTATVVMELDPSVLEPPAGPSGGAPFEAYLVSTSNGGAGGSWWGWARWRCCWACDVSRVVAAARDER